jgi:hypothetical protein
MFSSPTAKAIAFYLPQYHATPENDQWWGRGFTEWTNVSKAEPLFRGHDQPKLPADLGFYDLRVSETRAVQAELARQHGIAGFCYWHYWFAGKRLLERPFNEVLASGEPDFPFCLAWANESWSGVWKGDPNRILIEQTYPGDDDYVRHFHALAAAFGDDRYIRIDGKPLFVVYRPESLPYPQRFTDLWNSLAVKAGLKGIYFVGILEKLWSEVAGFDGYTYHLPGTFVQTLPNRKIKSLKRKLQNRSIDRHLPGLSQRPLIVSYPSLIRNALRAIKFDGRHYPSVLPNWDSTPRHGRNGLVLIDNSPTAFREHLREALAIVRERESDHRLIFLKSWNEWAEGNYVEPDLRFGLAYLEAVRDELFDTAAPEANLLLERVGGAVPADLAI